MQFITDKQDEQKKHHWGWINTALILCSLAVAPAVFSVEPETTDENAELITEFAPDIQFALNRFLELDLEQWTYQREVDDPDGLKIESHDPQRSGSEHWQLISVDGRPPTEKELEQYREDRPDHSEESDEKTDNFELVKMIEPDSIKRVKSLSDGAVYSFNFRSPDGKRKQVFEKLSGELTVSQDRLGHYIRSVQAWNREGVKPAFGVSLTVAKGTFDFVSMDGTIFPEYVEAMVEGRAFLIKKLDWHGKVRIYDVKPYSP